jgi:hypothetical protein
MNAAPTAQDLLTRFLAFSAEVTAFSMFQLRGTGQAESYLATIKDVLGESVVTELLDAYAAIPSADKDDAAACQRRTQRLRQDIFGQDKLSPIARNIIKLWYIGTWFALPTAWNKSYGPLEKNLDFVVSTSSYIEGLLWPAIGAHPAGAKAQGFGSWAQPPNIPRF